ncbi:hypothetical protein [Arthrobacter bambusae]|uniref:hypothetical protein n=1 Tax=Arthrobacter bambusae TaxID=1338426 RepID=UPI00278326B2|nr:hypothetical protein [Arthrobacter bambusae]MDQ0029038.1 hypothetical protein [Arthrobacter bambusae]MDQ0098560.1 hypothetical protein [Arthrobacter bambusae]
MVLLLWCNEYRHDFTTDEGFNLVVGIAACNIDLKEAAPLIFRPVVPRLLRLESVLPASR